MNQTFCRSVRRHPVFFEDIRYVGFEEIPGTAVGLTCGNVDIRYIRYFRYPVTPSTEKSGARTGPVDNSPNVTLREIPDEPLEIPDVSQKYRMSLKILLIPDIPLKKKERSLLLLLDI